MTYRSLLSLAFLALLLQPAYAGPTEELAKVLREAATSSNPTLSFLQGVGTIGDAELNREQVERALALANLPQNGALHDVLGPTQRIRKKGDRISMERSEVTTLEFLDNGQVAGRVRLKKTVSLRLRLGKEPVIDKVRGISVGQGGEGRMYSLWKVRFYEQGKRQFAAVTAGAVIFSKTIHIDLTPPAEEAPQADPGVEASSPTPAPVEAKGLTDVLGGLGS
jgi:hypothetical protein